MSIVRRIKHLLKLAKSNEGNEGKNALAAAKQLAEKHHVSWQAVEQETEVRHDVSERVIPPFRGNTLQEWDLTVLSFISRIRPSLVCTASEFAMRIAARHSIEANDAADLFYLVRWCVMHEALNCLRQVGSMYDKPAEELFGRDEFAHAAFGVIGAWHDEWTEETQRHAWRVRTRHMVLYVEPALVEAAREKNPSSEPSAAQEERKKPKAQPRSQAANEPSAANVEQPGTEEPKKPMSKREMQEKRRQDTTAAAERMHRMRLREQWMRHGYRYHHTNRGRCRIVSTFSN